MKKIKISEYFFLSVIFIIIFYIYLTCLFPTYKNNDSPEIASAAYTLGICHPPGYPLYINFSKIFTLIPLGNIAFRLNILSSFLAILTLFITYLILKNISVILLNTENKLYSIIFIFLLAFSYIFWNQSIEVKGGIYILNLLLLSLIIFLFLQLLIKFNIKYIYLITYLYAISLTNHWQSMIILLPWIIFIMYFFKKDLKMNNIFYIIIFFISGLSVYIFLWIRDTTTPLINWGNTSNVSGFIEFVLRKPYFAEATKFTINNLIRNIKVFFELLTTNYWFFWIFSLPGIYFTFKKNKIIFFSFIYVVFIFLTVVILYYSRNILEVPWLLKIFLLPLEYVLLFFIAIGIFFIFSKYKKIFALILIVFVLLHFKNNLKVNYRSGDFLSYDLAFNIFNTIQKDSYYFTEHDMYFFPVLYEMVVNKKRNDIKLISLPFLQFKWGRERVIKKYNFIDLYYINVLDFYKSIINQSLNNSQVIYRDFSSELFDKILKLDFITGFSGLLKTISKKKTPESPLIYKIYSLRGLYSSFAQTDENIELVARYMIFSALHAEKKMNENKYSEAIELFNFALKIPVEKLEYLIFYQLSICYNGLKDYDKELYYLNKCIQIKPDYIYANERLGIYFYEKGLKKEARIFLENAIKYGSTNVKVIDLYNNL